MTPIQYERSHDDETSIVQIRSSMKLRLRDFITKRHETFGGYIFNPYLFNHMAFSQSEMNIIDLINGENSVADIAESMCRSLRDKKAVRVAMNNAFWKAHRMFALKPADETQEPLSSESLRTSCLFSDTPRQSSQGILSAPLSVLWDITDACNLRCRPCLSGAGTDQDRELTTAEAENVIDKLAHAKVFAITFCGGEPFMRKDLFHLLRYASTHNIGLKISTNGTLVSKKVIKRLDECNVFAVQVSLDGLEKTHDKLRNKAGAWRKATHAIERFVEAGYYTVVTPVITRLNLQEIDALVDMAASLGASAFKPSLFMPAGRGEKNRCDLSVSKSEIQGLMSKLEMKQKAYGSDLEIHLESRYPTDGLGYNISPKIDSGAHSPPVDCSAGNTQLVIRATGDVAVCPFVKGLPAGNLREDTLENIWHTSSVLKRFRSLRQSDLAGKCRHCNYVPDKCLGGCRAAAYLHSGDLCGEDPLCRV